MTTNHHTPIPIGSPANASVFNGPLSELDTELTAQDGRIITLEAGVIVPSGSPTEYYDGEGNWTVPAGTGAGVDGHVIQDEGVDLVQRAKINFVGAGVTVTNEAGGTQVEIPGPSGLTPASIDFTATDKLLGRSTPGAGAGEEIPLTAAGRALIAAANLAAQQYLLEIGYGNALLNGDGAFWTRYVTPSTLAAIADDTYFSDRWYMLTDGGATDIQAAQISSGFANSKYGFRLKQTNATPKHMGKAQIVKHINSVPLRGKTVTFQFQGLSSATPGLKCAILEWTGTPNVVTSDVINNWASTNYTAGNFFLASNITVAAVAAAVAAAATEGTFSVTATISSSCNNIIVLWWTEGTVAQNVTVDVSQCDLHRGATIQTWDPRPEELEQVLCEFHCEKVNSATGLNVAAGFADSTSVMSGFIRFRTKKFAAPSMSYSALGDFSIRYTGSSISIATAISFPTITDQGAVVSITATGTPLTGGQAIQLRCVNANAYILIESEL